MSSKYGNFLTMFLVVLIVAILGILGYFVYDMLHSQSVNTNAQTALEQFEKATAAAKKENSNLSTSKEGEKDKPENTVNNTNTTIPATEETTNTVGNTTAADKLDQFNNYMNTVEQDNTTDAEDVSPEKVYMENYEVLGRIEIPKTKVDYPILENVTKRSLEIAVGVAYGPGLNQIGNTTIFGHNYRNGLFFSNNKKLSNGDKIYITDALGNRVTYVIYNIYQTTPNDASYMQRETNGRREISLQTCTDDSSGRIIIWAAEQE